LQTSDDTWKNAVTGFVNHTSVFQEDDNKTIIEVACETNGKCNVDQRAFKGLALRHYTRAALSAPFAADGLQDMIFESASGAAKSCSGTGENYACAVSWTGGNDGNAEKLADGGLSETLSVLEAVQAVLLFDEGSIGSAGSAGNGTTNPPSSQNGTLAPSASVTGSGNPAQHTGVAGKTIAGLGLSVAVAMLATFAIA
jgi:mannan endo-1,6-alpha-mannosidase